MKVSVTKPTGNGDIVRTRAPGVVGPSGAPRYRTVTPNNGILSIDASLGNYVRSQISNPTSVAVFNWPAPPELGRVTLELDLVANGSITSWPANSLFGYSQRIGTSNPPAKDVFLLTTMDDGVTIFVHVVGLNYGPQP